VEVDQWMGGGGRALNLYPIPGPVRRDGHDNAARRATDRGGARRLVR
jgi:hypothetical protein